MVSVALEGLDPESAICALEGVQLKVGKCCAPGGLFVTAALSVTVPENPPDGVTVMVDESPVLKPFASVAAVPAIVYAGAAAVTKLWMVPRVVPALFCATAWKKYMVPALRVEMLALIFTPVDPEPRSCETVWLAPLSVLLVP